MGFFSWKTQDTNQTIWNRHSDFGTMRVRMTDNSGNEWIEDNYNGYGVFGDKDFYVLMAEMNGFSEGEDEPFHDLRWVAITLSFNARSSWGPQLQERMKDREVLYPNLTEHRRKWVNERPEDCESQGFFSDC